jgi:hypothetical protein
MNTYSTGRFEAQNNIVRDRLNNTQLGTTILVDNFYSFVPNPHTHYTETALKAIGRLLKLMNREEYDKLIGPPPDLSELNARKRYGIARARCHGRQRYRGRTSAFTPVEIQQIVREFNRRDMPVEKLAEKWNISRAYVYVLVKKYGSRIEAEFDKQIEELKDHE